MTKEDALLDESLPVSYDKLERMIFKLVKDVCK